MTPSRKKPGLAFWATVVVIVVLVGYPVRSGPAAALLCILGATIGRRAGPHWYCH